MQKHPRCMKFCAQMHTLHATEEQCWRSFVSLFNNVGMWRHLTMGDGVAWKGIREIWEQKGYQVFVRESFVLEEASGWRERSWTATFVLPNQPEHRWRKVPNQSRIGTWIGCAHVPSKRFRCSKKPSFFHECPFLRSITGITCQPSCPRLMFWTSFSLRDIAMRTRWI